MNDRKQRRLLAEGIHLGFNWRVLHNDMGFRCGYIKIPETHPWYQKGYDDIDASVHGGLTYSEMEDDGHWIGFDCAHCDDAPDPNLPALNNLASEIWTEGTVRSQEYVEAECKSLCEQACAASAIKVEW